MAQLYPGYDYEQVTIVASRIPDTIVPFGQTRHTIVSLHTVEVNIRQIIISHLGPAHGKCGLSFLDDEAALVTRLPSSVRDENSLNCRATWHSKAHFCKSCIYSLAFTFPQRNLTLLKEY
jgi:hypothetical protein